MKEKKQSQVQGKPLLILLFDIAINKVVDLNPKSHLWFRLEIK